MRQADSVSEVMSFIEKFRATFTDSHVLIPIVVLVLGIALLVTLR
jgi:hypothetical protein